LDLNATLLGQMIAFGLFAWFCKKFVWSLLLDLIEERQKTIADGLAAADKGARSLELAEVEKQKVLDEARGQAREIIDQANTRANGIVEEARGTADSEAERILTAASAEVEQEVNRAREDLRAQVGVIALAGAEKIISKEIDASTHQTLLDQLAAEI
jgi:F-type H+-transporting ATPase subunit b